MREGGEILNLRTTGLKRGGAKEVADASRRLRGSLQTLREIDPLFLAKPILKTMLLWSSSCRLPIIFRQSDCNLPVVLS